jgi:hypothetical protein
VTQAALRPPAQDSQQVLRITQSPADAWSGAILPWFEEILPQAWQRALPSLVVVPTRSHAQTLKEQLMNERRSYLGVRFVTPPALREILCLGATEALPLREDLRLLIAVAAEQVLQQGADADDPAAKAVMRAPDHLLRTLERFEAAGWNFDKLELPAFRPIIARFREQLRACGFALIAGIDRSVAYRAAEQRPLFAHLLITGFDGAHWPYWSLLQAAVRAAENVTVLLEYPRGDVSEADSCWIGSWEEAVGEAEPIWPAENRAPSTDSLFTESEMRGVAPAAVDRVFAVGANATEQARAITAISLRFLAEKSCTRLGILFPGAGSLPRLVAHELSRLKIFHNDSFGRPAPGLFESPEWRAWLQLQRGPRINSLLRFLGALPQRDKLFPGFSLRRFDRTLRAAFSEILIDDVDLLLQFCTTAGSEARETATALRAIEFLPARNTLREFLGATKSAFARLGWKQQWTEISGRAGEWTNKVEAEFSRTVYLRWIEEIAASFTSSRDEFGEHPYARVQLLTIPQATGQAWSHLIFAGLNEGGWPSADTAEFAREEDVQNFNRSIQRLNRRAARRGSQGEGHTSISEDHSLYLGPAERRQIALRQFQTLLESPTHAVAFTAALVQDSAPDRLWNPGELFTRLYQERNRHPLTQTTMQELQRATAVWLESGMELPRVTATESTNVAQTRVAYDARRDSNQASGEYDFALRAPPDRVAVLSVSEFERLISSPALVWMKRYIGVEAADDDTNPWSAATGQWVHRWLAGIGENEKFVSLPSAREIDNCISAAAKEKCVEIRRICQAAGKAVPDWWNSGWQNAFCLARHLGAKLATIDGWRWIAPEWNVDGDDAVAITSNASLRLRGRIDVVLARDEAEPTSFADAELWILDYKTGSSKRSLASGLDDLEKRKARLRKKLLDGTALQLALYALAARQLGATEVWLSLLSPAVRPITPQLSLNDVAAHADIFEELARMQRTGIFGMHGLLRSAWTYTRAYPLATIAVDPDVLEQRWELTHPALVRDEDEIFW